MDFQLTQLSWDVQPMACVHSGCGLLNNKHPIRDLCSRNAVVPPERSARVANRLPGPSPSPSPHSLQLCCSCLGKKKKRKTSMIGFYVGAAGPESEWERELFWGVEVNMSSLNDFPFFPRAPSVHSKLFLRSIHTGCVRSDALSCHTPYFFFNYKKCNYCFQRKHFLYFSELCKTKRHVFFCKSMTSLLYINE